MNGAIMQPTYLPWLGYFDLMRSVNLFIIYDHVQFEKQSWQQRNRIRNKQGEIMLTIPVSKTNGLATRIKDVRIDLARNPLRKHLESIKFSYQKARNFSIFYPELERIYIQEYTFLLDLNMRLIEFGAKALGLTPRFLFSSEMGIDIGRVESLIEICKQNRITNYFSPIGSKGYIEQNDIFFSNSIKLTYQNYSHPQYPQLHYPDFISHLSFIDFLFNQEIEKISTF